MLVVSYDVIFITILQLIITLYFRFCIVSVQFRFFSLVRRKLIFCALKMLAVLANETSAVIKFKLAQPLCKFHRKNEGQLKIKLQWFVNYFSLHYFNLLQCYLNKISYRYLFQVNGLL